MQENDGVIQKKFLKLDLIEFAISCICTDEKLDA